MQPAPTPLKTHLLETIRRSGPLTFAQYMALCLYHADFGYYMQEADRTGVRGDYFTSSDLHPIFARLVARQALEIWKMLGQPALFSWVEMGAGRGLFALDFLRQVKAAWPEFLQALDYVAVEPGAKRREKLAERLSGAGNFRVIASLEELEPVTGCFFSNELVDAFPVAVVTRSRGHLKEVYVAAEDEKLIEKLGAISDPAIAAMVARYIKDLEEGCRAEVSLAAVQWMRCVAQKLTRGFVLTIDYGGLSERLYNPDHPAGTLLAYRGHLVSEDFFAAPGEQDLTAHVNFSALIDAGREAGLEFTGFTTQERFLMALGEENQFADLYDPGQTELEKLQARLRLKRLIYPGGMGSVFKVLVQHRGITAPVLTGLKFARR